MKTFRELYFKGSKKELLNFTNEIKEYVKGNWKYGRNFRGDECIFFEYNGDSVDKARVFIDIGRNINNGELHVTNIVPLEKNQLFYDDYNKVLIKFYKDIIVPYKEQSSDLIINPPSSDEFEPTSVISSKALKLLESFCIGANKSTGSSHPNDQERWFDFIIQTVEDGKMFDYSTLVQFLQDEDYWGKKPNDVIGVIGSFAWDEEHARELALDYENLVTFLNYYRKKVI